MKALNKIQITAESRVKWGAFSRWSFEPSSEPILVPLWLGLIPRTYFFPVEIFLSSNTVSDTVSDADSHDIKILN